MILFIINCMDPGGAERVTAHQANYWAERGRKVGIITYDKNPSHYPLHKDVVFIRTNLAKHSTSKLQAVVNNLRRIFGIRKLLKQLKPTAVIAINEEINIVTCLSSIGLSFRLILYDVVNPSYYGEGKIRHWLRQYTYSLADVLVVQTKGVKVAYKGFNVSIVDIKNPLITPPELTIDYTNRVIVSVGRLDRMKNLALIVKAFALVDAPDWEVRIFGAGHERANLEALIEQSGLEKRVFLKGLTQNVYAELAQASIFAFGSKSEGYPNALLEGLAAGLAVVSSDCPYGPAEIIDNEINGLLVPNNDEHAFAAALQRLIDDVELREKLGKEASKIAKTLSIEKIMTEWESIVISD